MKEKVTITIDREIKNEIDKIAEKYGMKRSALIEYILRKFLGKLPTVRY